MAAGDRISNIQHNKINGSINNNGDPGGSHYSPISDNFLGTGITAQSSAGLLGVSMPLGITVSGKIPVSNGTNVMVWSSGGSGGSTGPQGNAGPQGLQGPSSTATVSSVYMLTSIFQIGDTYKIEPLTSYAQGATITVTSTAVPSTYVNVNIHKTAVNSPNLTSIPPGSFNIHYEVQKSGGSDTLYTYADIYIVSADGVTYTLIGTTNVFSSTSNSVLQVDLSFLNPSSVSLNPTDRLQIDFYAKVSANTPDLSFYFDGTTDSRLEIPLDISNLVPYTDASSNVDLGLNSLYVHDIGYSDISVPVLNMTNAMNLALIFNT